MSHINTVVVKMTNKEAILAAAQKLHLEFVGEKRHELWGGQTATGLGFKLEGWNHPVVIDPVTGKASYDNFGGSWGKQECLDQFVQRYSAEVAIAEAAAMGYIAQEQVLDNGDLQLELVDQHG